MDKSYLKKLTASASLALIFMFSFASAHATFIDDFEDGNTDGWLLTSSGSGSTGVEPHNASQMAFAKHSGGGFHMLSKDFNYLSSDILSFDMHAVAYTSHASHAKSGVKISFLNNFNVAIGSASLVYATTSSLINTDEYLIDNLQHHYDASMSDFAALAGLGATDPISKISINFFAQAQTTRYGLYNKIANSSSTVWFDNVSVSAVPIPAAVWLFGSGLLGILGVSRRKKA
jgi:hypothetical protein